MRFAALLILAALGCQSSPPDLHSRSIGINDRAFPVMVVLAVQNMGGDPDAIYGVRLDVTYKSLISRPEDEARKLDNFDYRAALVNIAEDGTASAFDPGQYVEVASADEEKLPIAVYWELPDDAPPMIVIITASFVLQREGADVMRTRPATFVMQSQRGTLDSLLKSPLPDAAQVETVRKTLPTGGFQSEGFELLRASPRAVGTVPNNRQRRADPVWRI